MRHKPIEERVAVACQLGSAGHEHLVNAIDQRVRRLVFEKPVLMPQHTFVIAEYHVVVRVHLRPERVNRTTAVARRALHQVQIVGREHDGWHHAAQIDRPLRLSVQLVTPCMIFHGQGELEQPPIVFRRRFDQRTRRAASDHLLDGRMTKGGQRRHKLHGLDDVGFPDGVWTDEDRQASDIGKLKRIIRPEIPQAQAR